MWQQEENMDERTGLEAASALFPALCDMEAPLCYFQSPELGSFTTPSPKGNKPSVVAEEGLGCLEGLDKE